ncbi:MAG: hypothetical protein HOE53_03015 [Candidatus Magasanikbacteria bacterium]|jgi:hypothetical protein|nr:hypothetical protein [Candidatus Magasanikbacteria bacterium]
MISAAFYAALKATIQHVLVDQRIKLTENQLEELVEHWVQYPGVGPVPTVLSWKRCARVKMLPQSDPKVIAAGPFSGRILVLHCRRGEDALPMHKAISGLHVELRQLRQLHREAEFYLDVMAKLRGAFGELEIVISDDLLRDVMSLLRTSAGGQQRPEITIREGKIIAVSLASGDKSRNVPIVVDLHDESPVKVAHYGGYPLEERTRMTVESKLANAISVARNGCRL